MENCGYTMDNGNSSVPWALLHGYPVILPPLSNCDCAGTTQPKRKGTPMPCTEPVRAGPHIHGPGCGHTPFAIRTMLIIWIMAICTTLMASTSRNMLLKCPK